MVLSIFVVMTVLCQVLSWANTYVAASPNWNLAEAGVSAKFCKQIHFALELAVDLQLMVFFTLGGRKIALFGRR